MEFFPSLLHSRPAFQALRSQQPRVAAGVLDAATLGMALAATEAWAGNLQILRLVSLVDPVQWQRRQDDVEVDLLSYGVSVAYGGYGL